jgi:hypothetical protein
MDEAFTAEMTEGYGFDEPCVILGRPMMKDGEIETGATVQVPLFVNIGDRVKVQTASGEYMSRA